MVKRDSQTQDRALRGNKTTEKVIGGNKERRVLGKSIVYGTNPQAPSTQGGMIREKEKTYAQTSTNNNSSYVSTNQ